MIRTDFDPVALAKVYETAGADAISVLTDEQFFQGRLEYIAQVKAVVNLPILRKDFIIDSYQIFEARLLGADAVLLIARILEAPRLREFVGLSSELGLSSLVEIHDEADLEKAVFAGSKVIGINNRDLSTFATDLVVRLRLAPLVPSGALVISESGIRSKEI